MFPRWRLKLREAKVAYQRGRLDEASQLLQQEELQEFLPAKKLAARVAGGMVKRARSRAAAGDTAAGWGDLCAAEALGGCDKAVQEARQRLTTEGLEEAQRYLTAREPGLAASRLAKMERRAPLSPEARTLQRVAEHAQQAKDTATRGRLSDAVFALTQAESLLREAAAPAILQSISAWRAQLEDKLEQQRVCTEQLFRALSESDWPEVLARAEALLEIAPGHTAARAARRKAWNAVGMDVTHVPATHGRRSPHRAERIDKQARRSTHPGASHAKEDTVSARAPGQKLLLWIDAVGGFLVCLGDEVVIGQPTGDARVDVPILGDLSRRHAVIRREGGAYTLQAVQETQLNGRAVDEACLLGDGDLIQVGENVRLRFRKPHALSATARLDFESHHKTQPRSDGIVLMADTCVLGPKSHSHLRCRDWQHDVVLYRQGEGLACRATGTFQVDGQEVEQHAQVPLCAQVEGEDFSLSLEAV